MLHLFLLLLAALRLVASRHCGWADVTAAHGGYDFSRLTDCAELTIEHSPGEAGDRQRIGDAGVYQLARAALPSLTKLTLLDQSIGPAGAAELAEMLKKNLRITQLDLGENPISHAGTAVLAEALLENPVLTSLLAQVEDFAAEAIVDALGCNERAGGDKAKASACKSKLAELVASQQAQSAITAAIQAQAQLEGRIHQHAKPPTLAPDSTPPAFPPAQPAPQSTLPPHVPHASPPSAAAPSLAPSPPVADAGGDAARRDDRPAAAGGDDCVDLNDMCTHWAATGECERNVQFMALTCRKSCDKCGGGTAAESRAAAAVVAASAPAHPTLPETRILHPSALHSPPPAAHHVTHPPPAPPHHATPPHQAAGTAAAAAAAHGGHGGPTGDRDKDELLRWMQARHLTEAAHLPLLTALGVKRTHGRVGSLAPLRHLTFRELSAEIDQATVKGSAPLAPCTPYCAADKAALYEALQEK